MSASSITKGPRNTSARWGTRSPKPSCPGGRHAGMSKAAGKAPPGPISRPPKTHISSVHWSGLCATASKASDRGARSAAATWHQPWPPSCRQRQAWRSAPASSASQRCPAGWRSGERSSSSPSQPIVSRSACSQGAGHAWHPGQWSAIWACGPPVSVVPCCCVGACRPRPVGGEAGRCRWRGLECESVSRCQQGGACLLFGAGSRGA